MSVGTLAPQLWLQALDDTGVAVAGALVNFYASGTSTPLAAYADAALTVPLANPAVCDGAGRLVYYLQATSYKIILTTPLGVQIGQTVDPVTSTGASNAGLIGAALGDVFVFGGDPTSPVTAAAYPSGATYDKLHAGTGILALNSANLAPGTYVIDVMILVVGAVTLTVAIVNLTDGAPDTPLAEAVGASTTGSRATSGTITFAVGGVAKQYGIKTRISGGSGEAWAIRLVRTA